MAIGSPTIPVPGMPTPIAFFRILALSLTSTRSGLCPSSSVALAVASATQTGSVQPMAGTTPFLIMRIIASRSSLLIINGFNKLLCCRPCSTIIAALFWLGSNFFLLPLIDVFVHSILFGRYFPLAMESQIKGLARGEATHQTDFLNCIFTISWAA